MRNASKMVAILLSVCALALGCEGSQSDSTLGPLGFEECHGSCVDTYPGTFESCVLDCETHRVENSLSPEGCYDVCKNGEYQRRKEMFEARCFSDCVSDPDGDGVGRSIDRCPESDPDLPVNAYGCSDGDQDGVPDTVDECPEYGSKPLTRSGCPVKEKTECCETDNSGCCMGSKYTCADGVEDCCVLPPDSCTVTTDPCNGPRECLSGLETPVLRNLSKEHRREIASQFVNLQSHPVNCPGDRSGPSQPRILAPAPGTAEVPFPGDRNWVQVTNGEVSGGSTAPVHFSWEDVTDECDPVNYALHIEYYHCHLYKGERNLEVYRQRGWCEWQTLEYLDAHASTSMSVDLRLGEALYKIHHDFVPLPNPHWGVTDGQITNRWAPTWVRASVIAHDANGNASSHGVHGEQSYVVFFHGDPDRSELQRIPRVPWHMAEL